MNLGIHSRLTILLLAATATAGSAHAADRDYLDWAGVKQAWEVTRGEGVTIATLNTGVNYELPEFRGRIARESDGSYGFDAVSGCHDPMDRLDYGLGTQVASITAGNEYGIAPGARLVPVRIFDENGGGTLDAIAKGVDYAVARRSRVIEIGGGPMDLTPSAASPDKTAVCNALQRAEAAGALLVLSPGNSGDHLDAYPTGCALRNVVNVAAVDSHGDLSSYSNFGFPAVHLAAPAEKIWRISRDGSVRKDGQGTSFSSAFAAGVAALVWSAHPDYRAADVKSALVRGAVARDSLRGKVLSNGYLNANLALNAEIDPVAAP